MSESRAPAEPYTLEFDATVEEGGERVVLSRTYFYPEGGGQPADRGTVGGVRVEDVTQRDGRVVHHLAAPLDAAAGEPVTGVVDPGFRTYCMRAHTASHLLYGAGRRLLEDLGYGGFDIGAPDPGAESGDPTASDDPAASDDAKVRVDFSTPTAIDDETLLELERLVNGAVWDSRSVSWETLPREEALSRDEVAFNTKTEEGLDGEDVRIVTVEDWDVAACGGTHVRNTREIGPVTVLDRSNPGEGLTRVEFAVGPRAIRHRIDERGAAMAAARELGTGVGDLPEAVARLREERADLEDELATLKSRVVDARIAQLRDEVVERDGRTWLAGSVEGLDANELAERVRDLAGEAADVVALVAPDGTLAVGTTGDVDASAVVADVTDEFGGGGGGSPTVAQGGGVGADAETVVAFLRGED